MKITSITCLVIFAIITLTGCYSLPHRHGKWEGRIDAVHLYTRESVEEQCIVIKIQKGPTIRGDMLDEAVLVHADGYCYTPDELNATTVRVKGELVCAVPRGRKTGKSLVSSSKNVMQSYENRWLIKVKTVEALH